MRLTLTTNIGTRDAKRLGLKTVMEGQVVNVDGKVADELLKKGWATDGSAGQREGRAASTLRTTPAPSDVETGVDSDAPDFDNMTKEELHAFAKDYGISGVNMAQSKIDILQTVKKAYQSL
jgi:hypothetical protein